MKVKKTYRLEQETVNELEKLCSESGKTATEVIEGAIHDAIREPYAERAAQARNLIVLHRELLRERGNRLRPPVAGALGVWLAYGIVYGTLDDLGCGLPAI